MAMWHTRGVTLAFTMSGTSVSRGRKEDLTCDVSKQSNSTDPPTQGSTMGMSRNTTILSVAAVMVVLSLLFVVTTAFAEQGEGGNGQGKVTLCHNGHTITVGEP